MQKWIHTPIEFMVADNPGVVSEIVEQIDHQLAFAPPSEIGALINIADVDQNCVPILVSPSPNLRDATCQAAEVRISIIVNCRQNVSVQICRVQYRDRDHISAEYLGRARNYWENSEQSRRPSTFYEVSSSPLSFHSHRHIGHAQS